MELELKSQTKSSDLVSWKKFTKEYNLIYCRSISLSNQICCILFNNKTLLSEIRSLVICLRKEMCAERQSNYVFHSSDDLFGRVLTCLIFNF